MKLKTLRQFIILLFYSIITIAPPLAGAAEKTMMERFEFTDKGDTLAGVFYKADKPDYTLLLLHGFPGNSDDILGLGETLASCGINMMTFNYRGTFESRGTCTLANVQEDIAAAWRFLRMPETTARFSIDTSKLVLGGYSFGGGMGLTFAANNESVKRVISIAGTDHGEFARRYASDPDFAAFFNDLFKQYEAPEGPIHFVGREALQELQDNAKTYDLRISAPKLSKKELLLIGGLNDQNVTLEEHLLPLYRKLQEEGAPNITFRVFQDDHGFSQVREELGQLICHWIKNPGESHLPR
jgi:dipeptidyl aminopeptidase/acylaminoacyl peptidase